MAEDRASKATFPNHLKVPCGIAAINEASVRERVSGRGVSAPSCNDRRMKLLWVALKRGKGTRATFRFHCGLELLSKHPSSHPHQRTNAHATSTIACVLTFFSTTALHLGFDAGGALRPAIALDFCVTAHPHCPLCPLCSLHTTTDICASFCLFFRVFTKI